MNVPLKHSEVKKLDKGYHITRVQIGIDDKGNPIFYPNRRQRRLMLSRSNKNKITQVILFVTPKDNFKSGDTIIKELEGKIDGKPSLFYYIKRKIHHLKSAFK